MFGFYVVVIVMNYFIIAVFSEILQFQLYYIAYVFGHELNQGAVYKGRSPNGEGWF